MTYEKKLRTADISLRNHTSGSDTPTEEKTVDLDMSSGDMEVTPDSGYTLSKVTVTKPDTLVAENIRNGAVIGGVEGTYGTETQEKTVELDLSDGDQEVSPDSGYVLSKITIEKPDTLLPKNIKQGVVIAGVTGTYTGAVTIVDFATGSDEEIAAMIDAAQAGDIDLQTDGGWSVGDTRTISISAFTGGGSVSHAAQDIDIAISSFDDYESCGAVMQFDFVDALATGNRMNSSNTNVGGWGGSEMYTTTLPALVDALPSWLSERLITFSCKASAGNKSTTIETVSSNKLALRSEVEIFGTTTYSASGEGSQIPYYTTAAHRIKKVGHSGSAGWWWGRSPYAGISSYFCYVSGSGGADFSSASIAGGVAPFGCL